MRSFVLSVAASALLGAASTAPLRADSGELVMGLSAPRPGRAAAADRARFAQRLSALGLVSRGTLADGLGLGVASARATIAATGGRPNPFDLDPTRVLRVAARDSLGALAAVAPLSQDPAVEWIELHQWRETTALPP